MQLSKILPIFIIAIFMIAPVNAAVLGFTDAKIESNYFDFDQAWVVSWVSDDYTSSSLNAYLSPDDIKDISGVKSKQGLSIQSNTDNSYCEYNFDVNAPRINKVVEIEWVKETNYNWESKSGIVEWVNNNCINWDSSTLEYNLQSTSEIGDSEYVRRTPFVIGAYYFCAKRSRQIGTIGELDQTFKGAETTFSVQADGKSTESATLSNSETGMGRNTQIGNNVWVQWQGNLDTGENCPDEDNFVGIHSSSIGGWEVVKPSNYENYINQINRFKNDYVMSADRGQDADVLEQRFNSIARDVVELTNEDYRITNNDLTSGKVRFDLDRQLIYPVFRLIIDADYLELEETSGVPRILSVSDIEFNEGTGDGIVEARIKNIGDFPGGFTARILDCSSGFKGTSPVGTGVLQADETKTIKLQVTGSSTSTESEVSGECTLEVKDSLNPDAIDTETFVITMNQFQDCLPNERVCNSVDSAVIECNSQGTSYSIVEECSEGEKCDNGECVKTGGNGEGEEEFSLTLFIISAIIGLIGAIITYGYTKVLNRTKSGRITRFILSGAVFIGLFFLIPWLWKGIINMFSIGGLLW